MSETEREEHVRGWRIATAAPDFVCGRVAAGQIHPESRPIPVGDESGRSAAPGIAFVLGRPLEGPGPHVADVSAAVAYALAALEFHDLPPDGADHGAPDPITGGLVLGSRQGFLRDFHPRLEGCVLYQRGRIVATGAGAAVHGSPLDALGRLADRLGESGETLPAGSVVFSGPLTPSTRVAAGATVTAAFTHLGVVTAHFARR